MPKLRDLIPTVARATHAPEGTVKLYARAAREHGHIRQGGRGRGGAEVDVNDCVNLLLAVAGADQVKRVNGAVFLLRGLTALEDEALREPPFPTGFDSPKFQQVFGFLFEGKRTLADVMTSLIESAKDGALQEWLGGAEGRYVHLFVVRPFPNAWLEIGVAKGPFSYPVRRFGFFIRPDGTVPKRDGRRSKSRRILEIRDDDLFTVARITDEALCALGELLQSS